ncbi:MAG: DUF3656 domain-containing protein [Roseburia sp.]
MEEKNLKKIELLAPAGSFETFRAVISAGADAVYLGGSQFGARAYANNFDEAELLAAIDYAHIHGRQVYLTVNTLLKEQELERELYAYLLPYYRQGLDAVIVQDMGAFSFIREEFPDLAIHTSTQMTITGVYGARMMKELGASRVVTARELSFAEISAIHREVGIELESFVHGALCYCYSGQCLLSSMLGGRSGNRGRCAQPCRLPYEVYDAKKHPVPGNGRDQECYVLSPKDLCTIELIPRLIESGVYSFKIEGRMKQAEYAAGVVSVYREYIDRYFADPGRYAVTKEDLKKLSELGNRSGFTEGYYVRHNGKEMITFDKPNHARSNEVLQDEVRERYIQTEIKEKINGKLRLSQDFPAILELSCGETTVTLQGDVPQPAKSQPLTKEKVEANLRKTGNTPFLFENLSVEICGDLFLPVQALNGLRREGLEQLKEELVKRFRRDLPKTVSQEEYASVTEPIPGLEKDSAAEIVQTQDHTGPQTKDTEDMCESLAVSVESRGLLSVVLAAGEVADVYLDSSCYTRESLCTGLQEDVKKIKSAGKRAYFIFPAVFRQSAAEFYDGICPKLATLNLDGVVAKSFDSLQFIKEKLNLPVIIDQSLYTYNNRAKAFFGEFRPLRDTVPYELNRKELFGRDNRNSELVIYGSLPLMTSAQCVHANMGSCDRNPQITYLKDRYGKFFPVKNNCAECYNTIYNSTPLVLFAYRRDFERMGIRYYRLAFTTESEKQAEEILTRYRQIFLKGRLTVTEGFAGAYTNGHYKRGVE